jgi:hypothetical protein
MSVRYRTQINNAGTLFVLASSQHAPLMIHYPRTSTIGDFVVPFHQIRLNFGVDPKTRQLAGLSRPAQRVGQDFLEMDGPEWGRQCTRLVPPRAVSTQRP